jgi:alpha-D-xyloside xylohydrolase
MKKRILNYLLIVLLIIPVISCSQKKAWEKDDNGVIITLKENAGVKKIRLQVISQDIIRVTATPESSFSRDTSLIVVPLQQKFTDWQVEETGETVTLRTSSLAADVFLNTGEIIFRDASGNIVLQEKKGGGKSFSASDSTNGKGFYRIRQVFDSPDDEAFYGLGQHQHRFMNYKGKDVDLTQHNIAAVVPFLYSNKNYGILWDNYSITRFGDPRDYKQISSLKLYTVNGEEGGLTATYYADGKVFKTAKENKIDFQYLETPGYESLPKEVANDKGKIIWEGSIASDKAGIHKFLLYASNYFKLWVDDKLVMDKWRQNWNPWSNPFYIDMSPGEKHKIKIEWIPNWGYMSLTCLDPIPAEEQNSLSLASEVAKEIDYYFIRGNNADDVIRGYRTITGKAPIVPKWAMGFWQSRERYKTQQELLDVVKTFRKKKIPLDNIVLDWNYWPVDQWGSHLFDSARFPDAAAMNKELDQLNTNIMISVWPKFYPNTENAKEMMAKGYLFENNLKMKRKDWIWPGFENTFYDPFNPGARKMFWDQIDRELNAKGFDAWWLDATEPDMHSNLSIEARKLNMHPTFLGSGSQYFNAFSLMNSKGIYEEQRKANPDKRVFILTRSAYAGQQRYGAVTWSGDIASRWSDMRDQISAGVNFSLSGIPYWTMDIGGFALENRFGAYGPPASNADLEEWRELNTRWYQFGAFVPVFRVHGQFPFREIWNIAPENHLAYQSMLYYNKLRYRLMPYIYTLAGKAYHDDYTIMRGLVMDFGADKNVLNIDDQYMFGPALLINPVTEHKARERKVYLPAGSGWYDFYTGKYYEGGNTITAKADLTRIPVFVKEGSIIPAGPEIEYVNQIPDSVITIYVYGGKDGKFDIYSDEGNNYNYEKNAFAVIPINYNESTGTLNIGKRKGSYNGMLQTQSFKIIYISKDNSTGFGADKKPVTVKYSGEAVEVKLK